MATARKTKPSTLKGKRNALQAMELRLQGETFESIAKKMGYANKSAAFKAVMREVDSLQAQCTATAEQVVRMELEDLDKLRKGLEPKIKKGDPQAITAALRIKEHRAKLLGLFAPAKAEVSGPGGGPILTALAGLTDSQKDALWAQAQQEPKEPTP